VPEGTPLDEHGRSRFVDQRSAGRWPAEGQDTDQGLDAGHGPGCLGWWWFGDGTRSVRLAMALGGGGDEETRTPDPLLAKEMLYQLSYVPAPGGEVVGDSGLEPETSALSGQRSNQLS
jgi:hypothetical protein